MPKWESRAKEDVEWRYFLDGEYSSSCLYRQFVYRRADGTEFINQQTKTPVARVDGWATVERHVKTVQAFDMVGWLRSMGHHVP
jgi:hypothetical protein